MAVQALPIFKNADYKHDRILPDSGQANVVVGLSGNFGYMIVKIYKGFDDRVLLSEFNILTENQHPSIVNVLGQYEQQMNNKVVRGIVLEYLTGGSVHQAIYKKDIPNYERSPYLWIKQAAKALIFLHNNDIFHGDIKPNNMLLSTDWRTLKLCDFGSAQYVKDDDESFDIEIYSPPYLAPELHDEPYPRSKKVILSADNYALGITCWEIFHKRTPFDNDAKKICRAVDGLRPVMDAMIDQHTRDLCTELWDQDPERRCWLTDVINRCEERLAQP